MARIEVVNEADLRASDSTAGIDRKKAFDSNGFTMAQTVVPRGVASAGITMGDDTFTASSSQGSSDSNMGPMERSWRRLAAETSFTSHLVWCIETSTRPIKKRPSS